MVVIEKGVIAFIICISLGFVHLMNPAGAHLLNSDHGRNKRRIDVSLITYFFRFPLSRS